MLHAKTGRIKKTGKNFFDPVIQLNRCVTVFETA